MEDIFGTADEWTTLLVYVLGYVLAWVMQKKIDRKMEPVTRWSDIFGRAFWSLFGWIVVLIISTWYICAYIRDSQFKWPKIKPPQWL